MAFSDVQTILGGSSTPPQERKKTPLCLLPALIKLSLQAGVLLPSAAEGPKPVGQVEADSQTSPRPHTHTLGQQQTTPVGMMSWVSHDHLEACSVFHLSLPSLKSHISTFACLAALPPERHPTETGGCESLPTSERARVRLWSLPLRSGAGG